MRGSKAKRLRRAAERIIDSGTKYKIDKSTEKTKVWVDFMGIKHPYRTATVAMERPGRWIPCSLKR